LADSHGSFSADWQRMTREFRYAPRVVAAGYARSAFGLIVTLGPLIFLQPAVWLLPVLTVAAGLFLVFTATVAARHTACFVLSATGIAARGLFGATIRGPVTLGRATLLDSQ
jgi:hypothetical protein